MIAVNVPDGYEGVREWVDGTREWRACYREVGATFWTRAGFIGHDNLPSEELDRRAMISIMDYISAAKQNHSHG